MPPWSQATNDFGLEQADYGFGERVVIRVTTGADRGGDAGIGQPAAHGSRVGSLLELELHQRAAREHEKVQPQDAEQNMTRFMNAAI